MTPSEGKDKGGKRGRTTAGELMVEVKDSQDLMANNSKHPFWCDRKEVKH